MMKRLFLLTFIAGCGSAISAGVMVVNVDFQGAGGLTMSENGGAVIPFAGSYWNPSGTGSGAVSLLTSTGAPSGLELKLSVEAGNRIQDGDALYRDYVFGDATIRGLNPGQDYHVVIYSAANLQGIFRVAQPFDSNSPRYGEISCTYEHTVLPGVEGCDYAKGVATADAAGEIEVGVNPGAMSGLQISPVPNPEPSVVLLNLLAVMVGAWRRSRQRHEDP